jgi:hypothetical protein
VSPVAPYGAWGDIAQRSINIPRLWRSGIRDFANSIMAVARTFSGTITVNPDCTGTINFDFVGAPFDSHVVAHLVFEDGRKGIRVIQVFPLGPVATLSARRQ